MFSVSRINAEHNLPLWICLRTVEYSTRNALLQGVSCNGLRLWLGTKLWLIESFVLPHDLIHCLSLGSSED